MAIMLQSLYKALRDAGASDEAAANAATEVAGYENRLNRIESTLRLHTWLLTYLVGLLTTMALSLLTLGFNYFVT